MIALRFGTTRLDIAPERGGGVLGFRCGDVPVFAGARGDTPTDLACVALLPFANRIADGRFRLDGRTVQLPCLPGEAHALHGHGWLRPWQVEAAGPDHATLVFEHAASAWPWAYRARQSFALHAQGYRHGLSLTNVSATAMPAGLGLHPWFPRTPQTRYLGLHAGEWQPDGRNLPARLLMEPAPVDWWGGEPVATRIVDHCQVRRRGELRIEWPERALSLVMAPTANLALTHVYVPAGADFFCVEPVSHMPDAINRAGDTGLAWLPPGATMTAEVDFRVSRA